MERAVDWRIKMFEEKIVWHEITTRPLTEEEKSEYAESGYDDYEIPEYILSCAPLRSLRACSLGVVLGKSLEKYICRYISGWTICF